MRRAQRGDAQARSDLFTHFASMVHGCALAYLRHAEAHDVVQEVFIIAFEKLAQLKEPELFAAWLSTIARRHAQSRAASRRYIPWSASLEEIPTHEAPPEDYAEAAAALAAIRRISPRFREVLLMRLVEGLTGPDIAELTGLSHGTVRVYLATGMQELRETLGLKKGSSKA